MAKKFKEKNQPQKKGYFFEEILKILSNNPNKALNYKQIAAELNVTDHSQRLLINTILSELTKSQTVLEIERGKFKIKSLESYISGRVDMTSTGLAYIISEEMQDDVLINPKKTLNALHGDIVKVKLYPK